MFQKREMTMKTTMNQTRLAFGALILVAGFAAGCGKGFCPPCDLMAWNANDVATPDTQKTTHFDIPPESEDRPLALVGTGETLVLKSSLLVWKESVTEEQIRDVADASIRKRRVSAQLLAAIRDKQNPLTNRLDGIARQFADLDSEYADWRANNPEAIAQLREKSFSWFEDRVGELQSQGAISAGDASHAAEMFGAYCDFKIWELALSPVGQKEFSSRPTPHVFCEQYYATSEQGFFQGPLCEDPAGIEVAGKNYFSCLWEEGVLRTQLFQDLFNNPELNLCQRSRGAPDDEIYAHQEEAIRSWIADGFLYGIIEDAATEGHERQPTAAAILKKILSRTPITTRLRRTYPRLNACKNAFKVADDGTWRTRHLAEIKQIVEVRPGQLGARDFMLLPANESNRQARWEMLSKPIFLFGERESGANGINDGVFNIPYGQPTNIDEARFAEASQLPSLDVILKARPQWMLDKQVALSSEKETVAAELEVARVTVDKLETQRNTVLQDAVGAASPDGVAFMVLPFELEVKRAEEQLLRVRWRFFDGDDQAAELGILGCAQTSDTARSGVLCDAEADQVVVDMKIDSDSRTLSFSLPLGGHSGGPSQHFFGPEDLGFKNMARRSGKPYFNELAPQDLADMTLSVELTFNRLNGVMDFFTGSAEMTSENSAAPIQRLVGGMSGDNFVQVLDGLR